MKKKNKGVIIALAIGTSWLVVIVAVVFFFQSNKTRNKAAIDNEMRNTTTPLSCTEKTRSYNQGDGFDSTATWQLTYSCTDSLNSVYEYIKASAGENGYIIDRDKVTGIKSSDSYSATLCLSRNGYLSDWSINSNEHIFDSSGMPLGPTVSLNIRTLKYSPCTG